MASAAEELAADEADEALDAALAALSKVGSVQLTPNAQEALLRAQQHVVEATARARAARVAFANGLAAAEARADALSAAFTRVAAGHEPWAEELTRAHRAALGEPAALSEGRPDGARPPPLDVRAPAERRIRTVLRARLLGATGSGQGAADAEALDEAVHAIGELVSSAAHALYVSTRAQSRAREIQTEPEPANQSAAAVAAGRPGGAPSGARAARGGRPFGGVAAEPRAPGADDEPRPASRAQTADASIQTLVAPRRRPDSGARAGPAPSALPPGTDGRGPAPFGYLHQVRARARALE